MRITSFKELWWRRRKFLTRRAARCDHGRTSPPAPQRRRRRAPHHHHGEPPHSAGKRPRRRRIYSWARTCHQQDTTAAGQPAAPLLTRADRPARGVPECDSLPAGASLVLQRKEENRGRNDADRRLQWKSAGLTSAARASEVQVVEVIKPRSQSITWRAAGEAAAPGGVSIENGGRGSSRWACGEGCASRTDRSSACSRM